MPSRALDWIRSPHAALMAGAIALAAAACDGAYHSPTVPAITDEQVTVADAVGDTFGVGPTPWDITSMTVTRSTTLTTVAIDFSAPVRLALNGDSTALAGLVEFDVDQDSSTGLKTTTDFFRVDGGSTGMKADYQLIFGDVSSDSTLQVQDPTGHTMGRVKAIVDNRRLTFHIPISLFGGHTGPLGVDAIVGVVGRASDFIPQQGHLATRR